MFWAILLGASMGLQDRANDEMVANGTRPSWSRRHQILAMLFSFLALMVGVVVWINLAVAWPHPVLVGTAVLVVVGVLWACIAAYARAERRWGDPYQGTRLVAGRPALSLQQRLQKRGGGVWALLGIYAAFLIGAVLFAGLA